MAPAKFDDLSKTAKDVLNEDYAGKDISIKAKKGSKFEGVSDVTGIFMGGDSGCCKAGSTITTAVNFDYGKPGPIGAKITFKFPKPLGIAGLAFDKFELDAKGKYKLEASADKNLHGVADFKLDCKSDLTSLDSVSVGATYTGIANALIKAETKATNPGDYAAEASYAVGGGATVAVKSTPASPLDVGVQYVQGPVFCSVTCKNQSAFSCFGFYKASADLKIALNYEHGSKADGLAVGVAWNVAKGHMLKAKLTGNATVLEAAVKSELAKGVNVTAGTNFPLDGSPKFGMAFNIE